MKKQITWEVCDNIGNIIFNDLPSNTMNGNFFSELEHLVNNVIPDSNVKGIIIYGEGRHFSSGADVDELVKRLHDNTIISERSDNNKYPSFLFENNRSFLFFDQLDIPVISAIRGICFGSALELALFSDIRLCGEGAFLGFPEVSFNLMPGCGGIQKLVSIAGVPDSMDIVLTGRSLTSAEAYDLKIVDAVLPKKELVDIAQEFTRKISKGYSKYKINEYISSLPKSIYS